PGRGRGNRGTKPPPAAGDRSIPGHAANGLRMAQGDAPCVSPERQPLGGRNRRDVRTEVSGTVRNSDDGSARPPERDPFPAAHPVSRAGAHGFRRQVESSGSSPGNGSRNPAQRTGGDSKMRAHVHYRAAG